jgi:hypothetical protein
VLMGRAARDTGGTCTNTVSYGVLQIAAALDIDRRAKKRTQPDNFLNQPNNICL